LHPGIRWVSLPSAGADALLADGTIDGTRVWTGTKTVFCDCIAEQAVALLLACARRIPEACRTPTWHHWEGWRLRGTTVTVVGTGGIGASVASKLAPFGAECIGINRSGHPVAGFTEVLPIDRLVEAFDRSRAGVVCLPSTTATLGMIGAAEFAALGPDGILVNVGRGDVVDQDAIVEALQRGALGGAGLDVTTPEPLPNAHPLWRIPTVVVTSHSANPWKKLGWDAHEREYAAHLAHNVRAFGAGQPLDGVIDPDLGY
jgi:phosphoglycerate dehydrogenase-like enzyme